MNFVQEEKGYCNNEQQNLWLGTLDSREDYKSQESIAINFDKKLELMDLSLGKNNNNITEESNIGSSTQSGDHSIEKEHMFDKVVTPSDVGKLNRLVIPKQHAEKYFPLDSSSKEKGLLLNFEDCRNGKSWRFRYSYWNSSQSYVITKGWSRFVKEKKLEAGDIVSFQRSIGEESDGKDRPFYIDWRRRPNAIPDPTSLAHIQLQNQYFNFPQAFRWGRVLYSLPENYEPLHRLNYSIYPYNHHHQQQQQQLLQQQQQISYGNTAPYYHHQLQLQQHHHHQIGTVREAGRREEMVIDSVPVGNKTAAKRLRLFGVNMECCSTQDDESSLNFPHHGKEIGSDNNSHPHFSSSSSMQSDEYSKKGKSSLSIDLDLR